jgi:hypothetical protein
MVTVYCEKGYTIGFIAKELSLEEFQTHLRLTSSSHFKPKKILSLVKDDDTNSTRQTLKDKIEAEIYALLQCKILMRGHRLGILAEAIATEFQYDNKRLTIFLKKDEDVSVCRLVRKLYEKFKTRIKVIEVKKPESIHANAARFLELSKLKMTLEDIFHPKEKKSVTPFLVTKYQQLNGIPLDSPHFSKSALSEISEEYLHYGPSTQQISMSSLPTLLFSMTPSRSLSLSLCHTQNC